MSFYTVIGISFQTISSFKMDEWNFFETKKKRTIVFQVEILSKIDEVHGLENYNIYKDIEHITRREGDVMLSDKAWRKAIILPLQDPIHLSSFFCQLFYTHAVQRNILYLHSSLINYQESGLMFLGPTGIGKTTQAELWNQYRDALIINGDVVFVQETDDSFLGWGTPWHGSSPYCENAKVSVCAMIVLKQSVKNSIRELTGFEKVTAVSQSVFYPLWIENGMVFCVETLDHLLTNIPVYELSCRPDEDAVRLTEETVFGKSII